MASAPRKRRDAAVPPGTSLPVGPNPISKISLPDPSQKSGSWNRMREHWDVVRTCWGGTPAIRSAASKYLPKYSAETEEQWKLRRDMTTFFNVFADAIENTAARPFAKPIRVRETSDPLCLLMADDIDGEGTSLGTFARRQFREALIDGMAHCLVDYAFVPEGSTLADVKRLSARPYFVHIPAQDLIAAYCSYDGRRRICVHARIRETNTTLEGFSEVTRERVRVLTPGQYQLWERGEAGWSVIEEGAMVRAGGQLWDRVPLETYYVGQPEADFEIDPPFLDLAWKNIEHFQSSSDQRNILTKSRFPMLAASGIDPSTIEDPDNPGRVVLGPHAVLTSEEPHSKWYYVEARGSAIEQGRKDLESLEAQMIAMGVEPIRLKQNNQVTATQTGVDEVKARSILEQWATDFINYLERCMRTALEWQGIYGGVAEIDLTTDLTLSSNTGAQVDILLRARAQGDLSRITLWDELQRRDFLSSHFDPEVERALLEEDVMFGAQSTAFGAFLNSQAISGNLIGAGGTQSLPLEGEGEDDLEEEDA